MSDAQRLSGSFVLRWVVLLPLIFPETHCRPKKSSIVTVVVSKGYPLQVFSLVA